MTLYKIPANSFTHSLTPGTSIFPVFPLVSTLLAVFQSGPALVITSLNSLKLKPRLKLTPALTLLWHEPVATLPGERPSFNLIHTGVKKKRMCSCVGGREGAGFTELGSCWANVWGEKKESNKWAGGLFWGHLIGRWFRPRRWWCEHPSVWFCLKKTMAFLCPCV